MMIRNAFVVGAVLVLGLMGQAAGQPADEYAVNVREALETIAVFKRVDPGVVRFFDTAPGYAVFSTVVKGGAGLGGAGGSGVLFEGGKATGTASLAQGTIGLQLGGQTFSEVIFFETAAALSDFKKGTFALAAQASAVAGGAGTAATANYQRGVAVVAMPKGGLMCEASVGGQKFHFKPAGKP